MTNRITLNLPEHGSAKPPLPNEPCVTLNGVPIKHLIGIKIAAEAGKATVVNMTFHAEIDGLLEVAEDAKSIKVHEWARPKK